MAATSGGGSGEWEIDNDDGFVYKRPRGLYPIGREDAPSTPAPAPESVRLQRRCRALLRLRAKYHLELSRWESLSSDLLAPLPAPPAPPSRAPSASSCPVIASAATIFSDSTVLDDYLSEVEVQEQILEKASQLCDEIVEFCNEHEAAIVDAVGALPVWGNPRELVYSLCSPYEQAAPLPVKANPRELMDSLGSPAEHTVPGTH